MSELPDNNVGEARRWLLQAGEDLHAARRLADDPDSPGRLACFLAHLVAEKSLKALLISAGVPFPKTHDLIALRLILMEAGQAAPADGLLKRLNPWAIEGRYADAVVEADRALAGELVEVAERVLGEAARLLER